MLKYWFAILMCGCAAGSTDYESTESVQSSSANAVGAPSLGKVDNTCTPTLDGPICKFYYQCNPYPNYGPLDQYSINCSSPRITRERCFPFSYDPRFYSTESWAICCIHDDVPAIK